MNLDLAKRKCQKCVHSVYGMTPYGRCNTEGNTRGKEPLAAMRGLPGVSEEAHWCKPRDKDEFFGNYVCTTYLGAGWGCGGEGASIR